MPTQQHVPPQYRGGSEEAPVHAGIRNFEA